MVSPAVIQMCRAHWIRITCFGNYFRYFPCSGWCMTSDLFSDMFGKLTVFKKQKKKPPIKLCSTPSSPWTPSRRYLPRDGRSLSEEAFWYEIAIATVQQPYIWTWKIVSVLSYTCEYLSRPCLARLSWLFMMEGWYSWLIHRYPMNRLLPVCRCLIACHLL